MTALRDITDDLIVDSHNPPADPEVYMLEAILNHDTKLLDLATSFNLPAINWHYEIAEWFEEGSSRGISDAEYKQFWMSLTYNERIQLRTMKLH